MYTIFNIRLTMRQFVHLHVHSQYSLLDGQASISKLIDKAIADGLDDTPYRAALKGSGGLGYERPYLCQLVVPS